MSRHRCKPDRLVLFCVAFCAATLVAGTSGHAETPIIKPVVTGSLRTERGVRVLRLWGTPAEQGFAQGYLLGERLLGLLQHALTDQSFIPDPVMYERVIRPRSVAAFALTDAQRAELSGLLRGMVRRCGAERCRFDPLDRPIDVEDLIAVNTLADWAGRGCSSLAVWGRWTTGGETVVARNLDYRVMPGLDSEQLVIVRLDPGAGKKRWVSIGWPGLIGAYSAMNEDGIVAAMHDAPATRAQATGHLVPRSFVLRTIVETVSGADAFDQAQKILARSPTLRGNNFLLAGPSSMGDAPAVVFEYDGDPARSGFVTRRRPGMSVNGSPPQSLLCTNHYRVRGAAVACRRYKIMADAIRDLAGKTVIDAPTAWNIMEAASVESTLHTFVARPDAGVLWVSFAANGVNAARNTPVRLELAELFERVKPDDKRAAGG